MKKNVLFSSSQPSQPSRFYTFRDVCDECDARNKTLFFLSKKFKQQNMCEIHDFLEKYAQSKPKKRRKPAYKKPDSIKELERLHFQKKKEKSPHNPYPVKTLFRDDSANGLTKCIVAWLELHGHFAGRVNTTGTYSQRLGKYIHSGSRRGMADITAVIGGKHVSIEVKTGRDRMRSEQMKVKQEIEGAGGIFIVVSSFDDFLKQMESITNSTANASIFENNKNLQKNGIEKGTNEQCGRSAKGSAKQGYG